MIFSIFSDIIKVHQTLIASLMHIRKISLPGCSISFGLKYIRAATRDAAVIDAIPRSKAFAL